MASDPDNGLSLMRQSAALNYLPARDVIDDHDRVLYPATSDALDYHMAKVDKQLADDIFYTLTSEGKPCTISQLMWTPWHDRFRIKTLIKSRPDVFTFTAEDLVDLVLTP